MSAIEHFYAQGETTFENQDHLPPLPVPSLDKTLHTYLDSVKPHVSDEEFVKTQEIAERFRTGLGQQLQEKLKSYAQGKRNWLEDIWEKKAYLEGRYPIAPLVNICGPGAYYDDIFPPQDGTQVYRASHITYGLLEFWDLIKKEKIRIDRGGKTTLWCMNQYKRLFNGCRTPGEKHDNLNVFFKTEAEGKCPSHVTVMYHGRFFYFDVLNKHGVLLTPPELQKVYQGIVDNVDTLPTKPSITALTSDNRSNWYKNYTHLQELHPDNVKYLEIIKTAIINVVFDDAKPQGHSELCWQGIAGDCHGRWVDKPINVIVYKNGTCASNLEHSPFEGIVYIWGSQLVHLLLKKREGKWPDQHIGEIPEPKELDFHIDDHLIQACQDIEKSYAKIADNVELKCDIFLGFGKQYMKEVKCPPDTYIQMAIQLACYKKYQRPVATYETASSRKFWHGRTETLRSCTTEVMDWVKAMTATNNDYKKKNAMLCHLFMNAVKKHNTLMLEASEGQGCDRHLLALLTTAEQNGINTPEIYTDASFTKSGGGGNFKMSTSFLGFTHTYGGCAAMTEDGYGCFYSIQNDSVRFFIASWKSCKETSSTEFFEAVCESLQDIKCMLDTWRTAQTNKL